MPLRGLPSFRVGIDIVGTHRMKRICSGEKHEQRLLRKMFTPRELAAIDRGGQMKSPKKIDFLASRWACKEAIIKCAGRKIFMRDIEIWKRPFGGPYGIILDSRDEDSTSLATINVQSAVEVGDGDSEVLEGNGHDISGRESDLIAEPEQAPVDGHFVSLSLSHDGEYCVAVATLEGERGSSSEQS